MKVFKYQTVKRRTEEKHFNSHVFEWIVMGDEFTERADYIQPWISNHSKFFFILSWFTHICIFPPILELCTDQDLRWFANSPKGHVFSVHPFCWLQDDVELWSICVPSFVCHSNSTSLAVGHSEILIYKQYFVCVSSQVGHTLLGNASFTLSNCGSCLKLSPPTAWIVSDKFWWLQIFSYLQM